MQYRFAAFLMCLLLGSLSTISKAGEKSELPPATVNLLDAAATGNTGQIASHIHWKSELSVTDKFGNTALHLACGKKFLTIAQLLISGGASVIAQNDSGKTPLHIAIGNQHAEMAELLLRSGASAEVGDKIGQCPIHMAALAGNANIAKVLIEKNININVKDNDGWTALDIAVLRRDEGMRKLLADNGASHGGTANLDKGLHDAVNANDFERTFVLVKHGADVNAVDDIEFLPLQHAISNHNRKISKLLIDAGATLTLDDDIVGGALALGDLERLSILLDLGVAVNAKNKDGDALLHRAIIGTKTEVVKWLVENGADINLKSGDSTDTRLSAVLMQHTPLQRAYSFFGSETDPVRIKAMREIIRYLESRGAKSK